MVELAFYAALGLIVGSFLNVLIARHGGRSLSGRSKCASCSRTIRWYDLFPVFSWLLLKGKCRFCGSAISMQYPLVEILTACLFVGASALNLTPIQHVLVLSILATLVAIAVYDLRHTIIPDRWVYLFSGLALLYSLSGALLLGKNAEEMLLLLLSGPSVAFPLFALWWVSRGAWMGFGDVKLAWGIGWFLGLVYGLVAVFFAFVIGAVIGVALLAVSSEKGKKFVSAFIPYHFWHRGGSGFTMKSEVPFGPFLILSNIAVWFLITLGIDPLALLGF